MRRRLQGSASQEAAGPVQKREGLERHGADDDSHDEHGPDPVLLFFLFTAGFAAIFGLVYVSMNNLPAVAIKFGLSPEQAQMAFIVSVVVGLRIIRRRWMA